MARYVKLKPEVEVSKAGRIIIRDNRKTHFKIDVFRRPEAVKGFNLGGKSSKFLKSVVIPYYRDKVNNERKKTKMVQEKLTRLQSRANEYLKEIRRDERRSLKALIAKNNREFRRRVRYEALKKAASYVNVVKVRASKRFDGALMFPVIVEMAVRFDVSHKQMAVLILCYYQRNVCATDFIKWGYKHYFNIWQDLNALAEKGYLERFGDTKKAMFAISIKGRSIMNTMSTFYTQKVDKEVKTDEFKREALKWRTDF